MNNVRSLSCKARKGSLVLSLLRCSLALWISGFVAVVVHVHGFAFTTPSPPLDAPSNVAFFHQVQEWLTRANITFQQVYLLPSPQLGKNAKTPPTTRLLALSTLPLSTKESTVKMIALHLIPTPSRLDECLAPQVLKQMTNRVSQRDDSDEVLVLSSSSSSSRFAIHKLVHLHQDEWQRRRHLVTCRLLAVTGRVTRRIFARQTNVQRINATMAKHFLHDHHLWGACASKYYYGLFDTRNNNCLNSLVAVAAFSKRRRVRRNGTTYYKSHELQRLCTHSNVSVVGGLSKLLKAFERDSHVQPNDIVTVVDRNWGDGAGWHKVGFVTVAVLDPIVMAVKSQGKVLPTRRHLVGAGIRCPDDEDDNDNNNITMDNEPTAERFGLEAVILQQLNTTTNAQTACQILARHDYFPVYDAGVERLYKLVSLPDNTSTSTTADPLELWSNSQPSYPTSYYSGNSGITALLKHAGASKEHHHDKDV